MSQYSDTLWYNTGEIMEIRQYNETKEFDGKCTRYFEDGTISAIAHYKGGVKDGLWRVWHPNGNIAYELHYNKGERIGTWKGFDKKGDLIFERKY